MKKIKEFLTLKNSLILLYVLVLVGGYSFVSKTLEEDTITIEKEEKNTDKEQEIKPVKVTLKINNGSTSKEFEERMQNNETVLDLIERLRFNKQITYEKIAYIYGTELNSINGLKADETHKWNVYLKTTEKDATDQIKNLKISNREKEIYSMAAKEKTDITYDIASVSLPDNAEITIVYEEVENID